MTARVALVAIVVLSSACRRSGVPASAESTVAVQQVGTTQPRDSQRDRAGAVSQPGMLATVVADSVTSWPSVPSRPFEVTTRTANTAGVHSRRFGSITRSTSLRDRAPNVGQYPCSSCHQGRRLIMRDQRIADAHRNIKPEHPALTGATCSTCHASDNVERLALRSGEVATLDHSYRLCAQCHFAQAEAWAGGGHGKRLDGWQGRRVVMGCADCHDPHNPTLEQRIPFRAPRLARPRSDGGH